MTPVLVVGAGGFGREVAWLIDEINDTGKRYEFLGFLDDRAKETIEGYPVIGTTDSWLKKPDRRVQVVIAIGDSLTRWRIARRFDAFNVEFATLIHPAVRMSKWVELGPGTIVCANASFTTNIRVGAHSVFNPDCTVGHDTVLGDFTSVMPGAHLSGDVVCGTGNYFGAGSIVSNQVTIGSWSVVGAGAVVVRDLPSGVVAVGVPAKPIKENPRVPEKFTASDS